MLRATGLIDAEPDAALQGLTRVAARALRVSTVRVSLVDDERQFFCAVTDPDGPDALLETPLSHSLCKYVVHLGAPLVVDDAREDPRVNESLAVYEHGVRAYLGMPLVVDGHVLGSFCAVDYEPRSWTEDDIAIMAELAEVACGTLSLRARRADELLTEALDRAVLASLPDTGVMQLDSQLRVTLAEGLGFRSAGWSPERLVGRPLADVLPAEAYATLAPHYRAALGGQTVSFDRTDPTTGDVWWVQAAPVRDDTGAIRAVSVVSRDVTEARGAEAALAEREAQYRKLAENSETMLNALEEGIAVCDADNRIVSLNPSAERLLGTMQQINAARPGADVRGEDGDRLPRAETPATVALRTGEAQLDQIIAVSPPDGGRRWLRVNAVPLRDAAGAVDRVVVSWSDITELRKARDQARHQAEHDSLTGLLNRRGFMALLEDQLQHARRTCDLGAVLMIDLDGFKHINDALGHAAGDGLLQHLAARLLPMLRHGDRLARLGGDEFALLMASGSTVCDEDAATLAVRIRDAISAPFDVDGMPVQVQASVGIALFSDDVVDADTVMRHADSAMYVAKRQHARPVVYDPSIERNTLERLALGAQLRRAMDERELELHYQPICDVAGGAVTGVEALVRWLHPEQGMLPPGAFLPAVEQAGLMHELTLYVLDDALRENAAWARDGLALMVAVNVGQDSLREPTFPATVRRLLAEHGVPAARLRFEVTEDVVMSEPAAIAGVMRDLNGDGVTFSLDDFGTGYSSLVHLKRLPVSGLKIDRSFVMQLGPHSDDAAIVRAIIELARNLSMDVVAEGVETGEVLEQLRGYGCDKVQGYLISRPIPADAFVAWLRSQAHRGVPDVPPLGS